MISDEFIILRLAQNQPCLIKLTENSSAGLQFQRYRMFRGKNRSGFAQAILRDQAYIQIDAWSKTFALPPLEFCPTSWLETAVAKFETGFKLSLETDTDEQVYSRWSYIKTTKDERMRIQNKISDRVHRMYTVAQVRYVETQRQTIMQNFLAKGVTMLTPQGAASHEVTRQEIANVNRGVLVALQHCETHAANVGKPLTEFRDIIFEREKFLLERAVAISANGRAWDSITEYVDTPPAITNFFNEHSNKPWAQLSPALQEIFRVANAQAQADVG